MWANAACTERPIVGQSYSALYVRLGRAFGLDDTKEWGDPSDEGSYLNILCPVEGDPEDQYSVSLYVDLVSETLSSPFVAGQIVEVSSVNAIEIDNSFVFDFYDD